jgi:hypothetical protein
LRAGECLKSTTWGVLHKKRYNMEDNEVTIKTRDIGEGNYSIGSSVKGGLISIKIDVNDMEKTMQAITKCIELRNKVSNFFKLQEEL